MSDTDRAVTDQLNFTKKELKAGKDKLFFSYSVSSGLGGMQGPLNPGRLESGTLPIRDNSRNPNLSSAHPQLPLNFMIESFVTVSKAQPAE